MTAEAKTVLDEREANSQRNTDPMDAVIAYILEHCHERWEMLEAAQLFALGLKKGGEDAYALLSILWS